MAWHAHHRPGSTRTAQPGTPQLAGLLVLALACLPGFADAATADPGATVAAPAAVVVEPQHRDAPLVEAAHAADHARAEALLAAPVDVNQRSSDGTSALHWAVYHEDVRLVTDLLARGADPNARNDYGSMPLAEAAEVGNPAVVKQLLAAGANAKSANDDGQTALMIVARTSNLEVARLLLAHGADVNTRERWRGQTPLMWAAAQAQPEMVRFLIRQGARVNERSDPTAFERQVTSEPRMQARPAGGFTPLNYAARKGCLACAQYLIEGGADVNLADPEGISPLLLATLNLSFDVAALLVKHGADVDKWDLWGRSPLYAAVDMDSLPVGGRADRPSSSQTTALQLINILLQAGANPNLQLKLFPPYRSLRDDRGADGVLGVGTTPLLRAAKAGDVAAMHLLLAAGANPDLPTASGITPLMAASGNGATGFDTRGRYKTQEQAIEAVTTLLAAGAGVNERDGGGQTALHGAASRGWNDLIRKLVANRADVMAKDARGRTAADVAAGSAGGASGRAGGEAHPETAALLRELMAHAMPSADVRAPNSATQVAATP
jgi:ankyrin repeat protein